MKRKLTKKEKEQIRKNEFKHQVYREWQDMNFFKKLLHKFNYSKYFNERCEDRKNLEVKYKNYKEAFEKPSLKEKFQMKF